MPRITKKTFQSGVIEDPRAEELKQKDYKHEELAAVTPFEWKEVPKADWRQYPIFNQDGSGSCVAQSIAKALGIERLIKSGKFVFYSPRWIYTLRSNTGAGMWLVDALGIPCKVGAPVEQIMPSQNLSEIKMNDKSDVNDFVKAEALISKTDKFITANPDIETIASLIEPTGNPVIIITNFAMDEWNQEVPTINPNANPTLWHGVCAVQATLYNGKKAIIIDDSWGTGYGIGGKRIITEDWFKAGRVTSAGYFTTFATQGQEIKPVHTFTRQLSYGLKIDPEVVALQKCLNYLHLFPDRDYFTGNYYGITMAGVKLFQTTYGLPATGKADQATINKLNELFK